MQSVNQSVNSAHIVGREENKVYFLQLFNARFVLRYMDKYKQIKRMMRTALAKIWLEKYET